MTTEAEATSESIAATVRLGLLIGGFAIQTLVLVAAGSWWGSSIAQRMDSIERHQLAIDTQIGLYYREQVEDHDKISAQILKYGEIERRLTDLTAHEDRVDSQVGNFIDNANRRLTTMETVLFDGRGEQQRPRSVSPKDQ